MKILILSCNTGEGHNSAGRAVKEYLELQGHQVVMEDMMLLKGARTSKAVGGAYVGIVKHCPFLGHACPFFQPQKGGKAIAVSFGVLLGLVPFWLPVLSLAALYLIFSLVIVIEPHFYRSVCTFVLFSVSVFSRVAMTGISVGCCLISAVVIRKHYARYRGEQMSVRLALHR